MTDRFNVLPWHDAVLLDIRVNRARPGLCDEVTVDIEWPDSRRQKVTFKDCYKAELLLNFGVLGADPVRGAQAAVRTPDLIDTVARWSRLGVDLGDLVEYRLGTNSTASTVVVFARSFELVDMTD